MKEPSPLDGPREFRYIREGGARISEYESVNCYIQPNMRFDKSLCYAGFPDGRATWTEDSTKLNHTDWFAFRDPAQMWQRPYIVRQTEQEKAVEQLTRYYAESGLLGQMEPAWATQALGDLYLSCTFLEYAMFRACSYSHRECLSDTIAAVFAFNGFDKMRHAENILFYQQDLLGAGLPMRADNGKDVWMTWEPVQGVRRIAERLLATRDWGEIAVVINLVVEPLLYGLIANQILLPGAAAARDFATPVLLAEAGRDRQRNRAWSEAFVKFVVGDEVHGAANATIISGWLADWREDVSAAIDQLAPVAALAGRSGDEAVKLVQEEWGQGIDAALGLSRAGVR